MNKNLLILIGLGAIAYYVYSKNKNKSQSKVIVPPSPSPIVEEVNSVTIPPKIKEQFTSAFKKQYRIKLPAIQASEEMKEKGFRMQRERFEKEDRRQMNKKKVFI
jgi:hypothetical protein